MRILFVRHGEPDYEHDCLTPLGAVQAEAAAERLVREGISQIFTAPMGRAMETARAAADRLGPEPVPLDFMHELYWGSADGTPVFSNGHPWHIADEMARIGWDLTDKSWPEHPFFLHNRVTQEAAKVARGTDEWLSSLGYVREGTCYRCVRENDEQVTVALFSHGGSSSAAIARILNLTFPYVCAVFHMPFTSITAIRLDRHPGSIRMPVLELTGDSRHIEGLSV